MTQLGELRDAYPKFLDAGIALYAISYDDPQILSEFASAHQIPYPLLSDVDSRVIRAFGILNDQVKPGDGPLYGIPYPGTYITDEHGVVIEKSFHDTYKRRASAESLIDAALGQILLGGDEPQAAGGDGEIRVSAHFRGGPIKQGATRHVVVRFELPEGLHIYGDPVPEGMLPTRVSVEGPEGLVVEPAILPPTQPLPLESLGLVLPVWSGRVDIRVPVYALSALASECHPLEQRSATLEVTVRYQACDDRTCLLPRSEVLRLEVPIEEVEVPAISLHMGHGQKEARFDGEPHLRRLMLRKIRRHPLGFLRFLANSLRLEWAARRRRRSAARDQKR